MTTETEARMRNAEVLYANAHLAIGEVRAYCQKVADSGSPGEFGMGKEMVANAVLELLDDVL